MTKAETKALEKYPVKQRLNKKATGEFDSNLPRRKAYIEGYHQAIEDACEWLGNGRIWQYITHDKEADTIYMTGNLYEDLKQAMEE